MSTFTEGFKRAVEEGSDKEEKRQEFADSIRELTEKLNEHINQANKLGLKVEFSSYFPDKSKGEINGRWEVEVFVEEKTEY